MILLTAGLDIIGQSAGTLDMAGTRFKTLTAKELSGQQLTAAEQAEKTKLAHLAQLAEQARTAGLALNGKELKQTGTYGEIMQQT